MNRIDMITAKMSIEENYKDEQVLYQREMLDKISKQLEESHQEAAYQRKYNKTIFVIGLLTLIVTCVSVGIQLAIVLSQTP